MVEIILLNTYSEMYIASHEIGNNVMLVFTTLFSNCVINDALLYYNVPERVVYIQYIDDTVVYYDPE